MDKKTSYLVITLVVILVLAFSWWAMYYSYNRSEISLRFKVNAEIQKVEIVHDEMWKVISQEAQVTEEYRKGFDSIYIHIMDGRYSGNSQDGSLMKWIKESNPNFTPDLYKKLMVSIESLREKFAQQQIRVEDMIREHNTLCNDPWKSMFISNVDPIEYEVISSTRTKSVINTRKDDDIRLY